MEKLSWKIIFTHPWSMLTDKEFLEWMVTAALFTGPYDECKELMKNPDELVRHYHVKYNKIQRYPSSTLFFYEGNFVGSLFITYERFYCEPIQSMKIYF